MIISDLKIRNKIIPFFSRFFEYSENGWHESYNGDKNIAFFGEGTSGENGIRTLANYAFTLCFLYFNTKNNHNFTDKEPKIILKKAKSCIRFLYRTHLTGDLFCTDGKQWGGSWQSSWWASKLATGMELIKEEFENHEYQKYSALLEFEANCHLGRIAPTGLTIDTKAEENAWDNEIIAAALSILPENENAEQWAEKFSEFAFNTLSTSNDHKNPLKYDKKAISENVYTINLHSDFTLENHGSLHFCYIASPLLSITWSLYHLLSNSKKPPPELFHNVDNLWNITKPMFLEDRFAYIGGKDWARYTYGLYFIIPVLLMISEAYSDEDALVILSKRLDCIKKEYDYNNNGSFFGRRVTKKKYYGQNAKYETDCFACLALTLLLGQENIPKIHTNVLFKKSSTLVSPESLLAYTKSSKIFASFSWNTLTRSNPTAQFIPAGCDSMAEWAECNLLGKVKTHFPLSPIGIRTMKKTNTGFNLEGKISYRFKGKEIYLRQINYRVNANEGIAYLRSKAIAMNDFFCLYSEGLSYALVNDLFNCFSRIIYSNDLDMEIAFNPSLDLRKGKIIKGLELIKDQQVEITNANWINIDDALGIINLGKSQKGFFIQSLQSRNTGNGCLHYDIITNTERQKLYKVKKNSIIFDSEVFLLSGSKSVTREKASIFTNRKKVILDNLFN